MIVVPGRNVNHIFPVAMMHMAENGVTRDSRNGGTLELRCPMTIRTFSPCECVLFNATRRINPFLHLLESMWILAGRNDVGFLADIVPRFRDYSDDGITLAGAYGYRLRMYAGDQLLEAINRLKKDPNDRRVSLMISTSGDIFLDSNDRPCNLALTFRMRGSKLDLHVFNRSNDLIWGMLGSNIVHFSYLLQYVAAGVGVSVGEMYQITTCPHVYLNAQWEALKRVPLNAVDPYSEGIVKPENPFAEGIAAFDKDNLAFFAAYDAGEKVKFTPITKFFCGTIGPMWRALQHHKCKQGNYALMEAEKIQAEDWKLCVTNWLGAYYD